MGDDLHYTPPEISCLIFQAPLAICQIFFSRMRGGVGVKILSTAWWYNREGFIPLTTDVKPIPNPLEEPLSSS